jgi:hypothetical protein
VTSKGGGTRNADQCADMLDRDVRLFEQRVASGDALFEQ